MLEIELLKGLLLGQMQRGAFPGVDAFGNREHDENDARKGDAVNRRALFREEVAHGHKPENGGCDGKADGDFDAANANVERNLVFLIVTLITKHENTQRFQEKAPDHAEGVSFAEQIHVAAAGGYRGDLQQRDGVDHAMRRTVLAMGFTEPIQQDAVFGDAVENAVRPDNGGIDGSGENQYADNDDEHVEQKAQQLRTGKLHGERAEEVIAVFVPDIRRRNDHGGEQSDDARADDGVPADDIGRDPEVLHFRVRDFAVHLRERLKTAHGKQGVSERNDHRYKPDLRPERAFIPAERRGAELQIMRDGRGGQFRLALEQDGQRTPEEKDDDHDGRNLHDAQRFAAGLMQTLDVRPPEIGRKDHAKKGGERVRVERHGLVHQDRHLVQQASEILSGGDDADWPGEYVIEDERGYG